MPVHVMGAAYRQWPLVGLMVYRNPLSRWVFGLLNENSRYPHVRHRCKISNAVLPYFSPCLLDTLYNITLFLTNALSALLTQYLRCSMNET